MSTPAKMSGILPTPCTFVPRLANERQIVGLPGPKRPVVAVRRARVAAGLADERPGDDTADGVLAGEDLPGDPAGLVEFVERDRLSCAAIWKTESAGRVHDPLAGSLVFLSELLDDLGARRGLLPSTPRPVRWANSSITSKGKPCG